MDLLWIYAALLPCAAHRADWERWERLIARIQSLLAKSGIVDEDIPSCLQLGADLAARAGQVGLARHAYELAIHQWRAAGLDATAEEVAARLAEL